LHEHRPYWHCLAFAGIWYAAIVLLNLLNDNAAHTLMLGVVPWLGTSVALLRVAHGGMKAWRLILLGLPIFYFLWAITVVIAHRFVVPVTG
jgi:ABC-type Na+ efflux pump permease subunit